MKSRCLLPDKYNKTGDLDIVDKIQLRGLFPDQYNKTCDLDIVDKSQLRGLLSDKDKKIGDLDLIVKIKRRDLLPDKHNKQTDDLGDNCIVFENFTASIGDLIVSNWVYWRRAIGASKRIFAIMKSTIDAMKYSNTIQLSPFQCNHVYYPIIDKMT